jgi:hypothetical protein
MDTTYPQPKTKMKITPSQVTHLSEVVETIVEDALAYARAQIPSAFRDQDLSILLQDRDFFCRFKCGLSLRISQILAEFDKRVLEIYSFDPYTNPDVESGEYLPLDGNLNLLMIVSSPSAGLEAFFTSLDRALTSQLKLLPLPMLAQYQSVLNAVPVTEKDIKLRRGLGALASSVFSSPMKTWPLD